MIAWSNFSGLVQNSQYTTCIWLVWAVSNVYLWLPSYQLDLSCINSSARMSCPYLVLTSLQAWLATLLTLFDLSTLLWTSFDCLEYIVLTHPSSDISQILRTNDTRPSRLFLIETHTSWSIFTACLGSNSFILILVFFCQHPVTNGYKIPSVINL